MPTFETWVSHQRSWYKEVGQPGCLQGNHVATLCNDVTTDTPFAWDGYLTHAETPAASFLVVRMLLVVRPGASNSVLAPSSLGYSGEPDGAQRNLCGLPRTSVT